MTESKRSAFTVEPGRVILKDGDPFILIAVPSAFFKDAPTATQEEADAITVRIAELLSKYGS